LSVSDKSSVDSCGKQSESQQNHSLHLKNNFVMILFVLVLTGIELIFFLVAGIVLCFGFSMRRMLIMYWCFSRH